MQIKNLLFGIWIALYICENILQFLSFKAIPE